MLGLHLDFPTGRGGAGRAGRGGLWLSRRPPSGRSPHLPYAWWASVSPSAWFKHTSQDLTEPSEVQWVGLRLLPSSDLQALASNRWRPVPPSGPSIWDLNRNPQPHLLAAASQMLSRVDGNQGWGGRGTPPPQEDSEAEDSLPGLCARMER